MQMARAEDERFWQNAVKIQSAAVVLVYFSEQERIEQSVTQIETYKRTALDGKEHRFRAEKQAEAWKAGAELRARHRQIGDKCWERIQQLPRRRQQRLLVEEDEDCAREMGLHVHDWLDEDAARGATRH
jgi:hypothetical protein